MEIPKQKILVLDFGSQVSHLICRRCREINVYSELRSCVTPLKEIQAFAPSGIILSGGPSSTYEEDSPHVPAGFFEWVKSEDLPVLGICYGMQEMMHQLGGTVEPGVKREFGHADMRVGDKDCLLFNGLLDTLRCWMSHGDKVTALAPGFQVVASTDNCEFAAVADASRKMWAVQFHPEVTHTECGTKMIENFIVDACGCKERTWTMSTYAEKEVARIKALVGDRPVVAALSGGVDSTVGGALIAKALGKNFHPFLVDTGLLRLGEAAEVKSRLEKQIPGIELTVLDASEEFYKELAGVHEPEKKRKIIGRLFIESFEKAISKIGVDPNTCFLLQGTLYPDVIESTSYRGPSSVIKTHHNVGGLPEKMKMTVLEPLRLLFKDEVRELGRELGLSKESVGRHPFPGPGLAIRIMGEVNRENADMLRQADHIFISELRANNEYDKIGQAFVVLMPDVRSTGVMGDKRTYERLCCLRSVQTTDFMTADWYRMPYDLLQTVSNRIINEVKGINRVCYDVTSKPPGTIEWE